MNNDVNKKAVLITLLLTTFIGASNMSMLNVALPVIGRELSMNAILLGWVVTGPILATAAFQVPMGRFADIFGRKRIFFIGSIIFTFSNLLGGLANSGMVLILARGLNGTGGAMMGTTGLAILTSVFKTSERGQAIAASMASVYLGIALGPFMGGLLTEYLGWRSIFYICSAVCLISIALIIFKLKGEWAEARGEDFDYKGTLIFAIAISASMYGFAELPSFKGIVIFIIGMAGMLFFILLENRITNPIFDIRVFRSNSVFVLSNLATLINYCGAFAATFLMSLYLQYILGFPPRSAGIVLVAQPILMTLFALASGKLANAFSPRHIAAAGLALNCCGLGMLVFLGKDSAVWYVLVSLSIFGIGGGLFSSPNANMSMSSVENRFFGVASGVIATMRSAGMILSMGITMILFTFYIGNAEVTPEHYTEFLTSMRTGFIIFSVLCFVGIFVQLSARRKIK